MDESGKTLAFAGGMPCATKTNLDGHRVGQKPNVIKSLMPESKPWMNERRRMSDEMIGLDGLDRGADMGRGDGTSRPTMRPHPGLSPGKP